MRMTTWRRRLSKEGLPKARRRSKLISESDLFSLAEVVSYEIGQDISQWRRSGSQGSFEDIERNILTLLEVCRELRGRQG
jgi:hypothetical protein